MERVQELHQDLAIAQIMHIEAISDLEVLTQRNSSVKEMLEGKRQEVQVIAGDAQRITKQARALLDQCKEILADPEVADVQRNFMETLPPEQTPDELESEIESEKAKLELIHEGNPNAISEFENRQRTIDGLTDKIAKVDEKLSSMDAAIAEIREKWEPELDELVRQISEAFSYSFEKIGCAGQVGIHKDEDFDQWAIQIQVKFRFVHAFLPEHGYRSADK